MKMNMSQRFLKSLLAAAALGLLIVPGLLSPAHSEASVVTSTQVFDLPDNDLISTPCGEDIQLSGYIHVERHITSLGGGTGLFEVTVNAQGVTGVGLTTGTVYQDVGMTRFTRRFVDGEVVVATFTDSNNIIGPGPDNNYLEFEDMHVTMDANGDTTVSFDNSRIECR